MASDRDEGKFGAPPDVFFFRPETPSNESQLGRTALGLFMNETLRGFDVIEQRRESTQIAFRANPSTSVEWLTNIPKARPEFASDNRRWDSPE